MRSFLLACSLVLAACSGDSDSGDDDAAGAFGAACTTASDSSTECDSGVCTNSFDMVGHPVCSQKCTAGMDATCPAGSGGSKCNMKGYCRP